MDAYTRRRFKIEDLWKTQTRWLEEIRGQQIPTPTVNDALFYQLVELFGGSPGWIRQKSAPDLGAFSQGDVYSIQRYLPPLALIVGLAYPTVFFYTEFDLDGDRYDFRSKHNPAAPNEPCRPSPRVTTLPPAWLVLR
jgi:hypothetical protein